MRCNFTVNFESHSCKISALCAEQSEYGISYFNIHHTVKSMKYFTQSLSSISFRSTSKVTNFEKLYEHEAALSLRPEPPQSLSNKKSVVCEIMISNRGCLIEGDVLLPIRQFNHSTKCMCIIHIFVYRFRPISSLSSNMQSVYSILNIHLFC